MGMYIIFCGNYYYPLGGAYDIYSVKDTLRESREISFYLVNSGEYEWSHVFDCKKEKIIIYNDRAK